MPPDGVVTRKEFVDRIVDIFVQRRSLQLTLADYEVGLVNFPFFFFSWCLFQKGLSECHATTKSCCSRLRIVLNPPWCCRFLPAGENANLVSGHPDEGGLPPLGGVDLRGRVHRVPDPWRRHRQPHPHLGTCVCSSRGTGAVKTGFSVYAVRRRQQETAHLSIHKISPWVPAVNEGELCVQQPCLSPAAQCSCGEFVPGKVACLLCFFSPLLCPFRPAWFSVVRPFPGVDALQEWTVSPPSSPPALLPAPDLFLSFSASLPPSLCLWRCVLCFGHGSPFGWLAPELRERAGVSSCR